MPHSFPIYFDDPPKPPVRVVFAVAAVDAFTGRVVTSDIEVHVDGLHHKPIRNRTGLRVFVDLPVQKRYDVEVKAVKAGYFDGRGFIEPPEIDDTSAPADRLLTIPLYRRPSKAAADEDSTVIAGVLERNGDPVALGSVSVLSPADPSPLAGPPPATPFVTLSDRRGAFALALRLWSGSGAAPITVRIKFAHDTSALEFDARVRQGRLHSFERVIDFVLTDPTNPPALVPFGG